MAFNFLQAVQHIYNGAKVVPLVVEYEPGYFYMNDEGDIVFKYEDPEKNLEVLASFYEDEVSGEWCFWEEENGL